VPAKISQLLDDQKRLRRRSKVLFEQAAEALAEQWRAAASEVGELGLIARIAADVNLEELQILCRRVVARPQIVCLAAVADGDRGRLVFASSAEGGRSMGELMKQVAPAFDGRGGGGATLAQGAIASAADLEAALADAEQRFRAASP
jgi:alanyl-tRNA synthetase